MLCSLPVTIMDLVIFFLSIFACNMAIGFLRPLYTSQAHLRRFNIGGTGGCCWDDFFFVYMHACCCSLSVYDHYFIIVRRTKARRRFALENFFFLSPLANCATHFRAISINMYFVFCIAFVSMCVY